MQESPPGSHGMQTATLVFPAWRLLPQSYCYAFRCCYSEPDAVCFFAAGGFRAQNLGSRAMNSSDM